VAGDGHQRNPTGGAVAQARAAFTEGHWACTQMARIGWPALVVNQAACPCRRVHATAHGWSVPGTPRMIAWVNVVGPIPLAATSARPDHPADCSRRTGGRTAPVRGHRRAGTQSEPLICGKVVRVADYDIRTKVLPP
jgi:hypothetical protein